ncbi:MAG: hypothetical protein ACHREM_07380, partial [Polyangiales bacterium]
MSRAWRVWVCGLLACVLGCASKGGVGEAESNAADASLAEVAVARPNGDAPSAVALRLVAGEPVLTKRLQPAPGTWQRDADVLTSPGFRSAKMGAFFDVGARLPARADGTLRIGIAQADRYTLSLKPDGAHASPLDDRDGRAAYVDAWPSTDLVWVAEPTRVEAFLILRDASAPTEFAWQVTLPEYLPTVKTESTGAIVFVDKAGTSRLRVPKAFAIDAKGTRKEAMLAYAAGRLSVQLDASGLVFPVLLDPAVESVVWTPVASSGPPARYNSPLAYDSAHGKTVLFGGGTGGPQLGDTWEWDGTTWTNPANSGPPAREEHGLVYDSARGKTVLFGGFGSTGYLGDTWEWDGTTWTNRTNSGPSARADFPMAYESARAKTVLYGGAGGSTDTWEWDGTSWSNPATTGPGGGEGQGMAYDIARGNAVLFGGSYDYVGETWTWGGTAWANPTGSGPGPRGDLALAYDSARQSTVLFGGLVDRAGVLVHLGDTWEWSGTAWTETATTGPSARRAPGLAFDSARGRTVLFGGDTANGNGAVGDTWEYHGRGGPCSCGSGTSCASSSCDTGFCIDGVCCEGSSLATTSPPNCGTCRDCNTAATPGFCATITNVQDPDSCAGAMACGSTGNCGIATGQPCTSPTTCALLECVNGVCCNTACNGGVGCSACDGRFAGSTAGTCAIAPAGYAGSPSCTPYQCDGANPACPNPCTSDNDCVAGAYCNASGACVTELPQGAKCNTAAGAIRTVVLAAYSSGAPTLNTLDFEAYYTSETLASGSYSGKTALSFTATSDGTTGGVNKYAYWQCSNSSRTILTGDYVEYDVYLVTSIAGLGGIDIENTDGTYWRDYSGWADQNGIAGHPSADLTPYASGQWYHRSLAVPPAAIGKTIGRWDVVDQSGNVSQTALAYYANLVITNGSTSTGGDCMVTGCHECNTAGACVDGYCCNTACTGTCMACNLSGTAGTCSPVYGANFPRTCPGTNTCDAIGACKSQNGQA